MRGGGKASDSGSSAARGRAAALKEKRQQSGEDSDESIQQPKRKEVNKDPSAAEVAREESRGPKREGKIGRRKQRSESRASEG